MHAQVDRAWVTLPAKMCLTRRQVSQYWLKFPELKNNKKEFYKYMRMKPKTFNYILSHIEGSLEKKWPNFIMQPIVPEEKLVVTLR